MDKAEYRIKLEQINALAEEGDFRGAAEIADEIDWRHVKSARTLCMIGEIYEANKRYDDSRRILKYAYKRSASSKTVLYRLAELDIRTGNYDEARKFINEFESNSPNDTSRLILKYKLLRATKAPLDDQIEVLREYKDSEYTERWAYELAKLYKRNGQKEKCIEECDDMILWFAEGKYVTKAMELKMSITELTPIQRAKYESGKQREEKESVSPEPEETPETPAPADALEAVEKTILAADNEDEEVHTEISASEAIEKLDSAAGRFRGGEVQTKTEESRGGVPRFQDRLTSSIRNIFSGMRLEKTEEEIREEEELAAKAEEAAAEENTGKIPQDAEEAVRTEEAAEAEALADVFAFAKQSVLDKKLADGTEAESEAEAPQKAEETFAEETLTDAEEVPAEEESADAEEVSEELEDIPAGAEETAEEPGEPREAVPEETAKEPGEAEIPEETAGESREAVPEETAEEPGETEIPEETAEEPGETEVPEEAAEAADTEVPEEAGAEPADAEETTDPNGLPMKDGEVDFEKLFAMTGSALAGEVASGNYVMADTLEEDREEAEEIAEKHREAAAEPDPEELLAAAAAKREADLIGRETDESLGLTREFHFRAEDMEREAERADSARESAPIEDPEIAAKKTVCDEQGVAFEKDGEDSPQTDAEALPYDENAADEELLAVFSDDDLEIPEEEHETLMGLAGIGDAEEQSESDTMIQDVMGESGLFTVVPVEGRELTGPERTALSYFASIPGIDIQTTSALADIHNNCGDKTSRSGNVLIMGRQGSGKTRLADGLILMTCLHLGIRAVKVGRIVSNVLNGKDPASIVKKLAGGFLIVEAAGDLNDETVDRLNQAMEFRTDALVVILEDEREDLKKLLDAHPAFAEKFTSRITVPIFTNDELVNFAKIYAAEEGFKFDELSTLALYQIIGKGQKGGEPMTVGNVREIVDRAIDRNHRKLFGRVTDKEDGMAVLGEKDFS